MQGVLRMKRFSRLFWFTVIAGAATAALLSCGLVWHLAVQTSDWLALCTKGEVSCPESIDRAFLVFCMMVAAGNILMFRLAYLLGRRWIKPTPLTVTDASQ